MSTRTGRCILCGLAGALVSLSFAGCKKEEPKAPAPPAERQPEPPTGTEETAAATADVEAKLAAADAYDGTTDKVVSKCPICGLGMDGSSEHALEFSGYTLHFCTATCKQEFETHPTETILALQVPED